MDVEGATPLLDRLTTCRRLYGPGLFDFSDSLDRAGTPRCSNDVITINELADDRRVPLARLQDRSVAAAIDLHQLRLPMAERRSRDVIAEVERQGYPDNIALLPAVILAQIAYERGDLIEADAMVRAMLPRLRKHGTVETSVRAYTTLSRIALGRHRSEFASTILREGELLGQERGWPRLAAACLAEQIDMMFALERRAEAQASINDLMELYRISLSVRKDCRIAHHCLIACCRNTMHSRPQENEVALIRRLYDNALAHGDSLRGIELGIDLAAVFVRAGNQAAAIATLTPLVITGCDKGLFQTFLRGNAQIRQLLETIQPGLPAPHLKSYVTLLIEHWLAPPPDEPIGKGGRRSGSRLTPREHNVLQLISQGHSNKRIAQRLGIAPETVKSHAKNLFARLESTTRAEAVARAASLGII